MKCPKCHYLSFEPEPRCRNCGYDLELAADDLPITLGRDGRDEREGPLADLALRPDSPDVPDAFGEGARAAIEAPEVDESGLPPIRRPVERPARRARPAPTTELPLFVKGLTAATDATDDPDAPLVRLPAEPRPPVAVQRRAPDSGLVRAPASAVAVAEAGGFNGPEPPSPGPASAPAAAPGREQPERPRRLGTFGRDLLQDLERLDRRAVAPASPARRPGASVLDVVAPGTRLAAAAIDLGFLGTLAVGVFWLTLRWCELTLNQAASLPLVPLSAFVLLVVTGYLLLFTAAGGQTIGKMACGLRVTSAHEDGIPAGPVTPGQAFLRALLTVPSVLALGAGFLPALVGEGRAFHDRLTQTRVVRA
jgi:uncharacterized RDD family membrane protein YckC